MKLFGGNTMKTVIYRKIIKTFIVSVICSFGFFSALKIFELGSGVRLLTVQSGSMAPVIPTGSLVITRRNPEIVAPIHQPRFLVGDVITFSLDNGALVSHRIVDIQKRDGGYLYQTKGDANQAADSELVDESDIVGQLVYSIPYLGKIQLFARQPAGFILLVLIPCTYVIIFEVITIVKEVITGRKSAGNLATLK